MHFTDAALEPDVELFRALARHNSFEILHSGIPLVLDPGLMFSSFVCVS